MITPPSRAGEAFSSCQERRDQLVDRCGAQPAASPARPLPPLRRLPAPPFARSARLPAHGESLSAPKARACGVAEDRVLKVLLTKQMEKPWKMLWDPETRKKED